ncbi:hypothetical protein CUR178_06962 [Leishmania enriettii]|uniref:Uncharacterized protein n=1 Tax=Leishmania enriettii TaxID=5663 RepID=A0A836KSY4_LEIEN|nr:hypothetical protein CUR178_06962 [Leishmania enriettii]
MQLSNTATYLRSAAPILVVADSLNLSDKLLFSAAQLPAGQHAHYGASLRGVGVRFRDAQYVLERQPPKLETGKK